jgi:serine/alanine adding enzyme
MSTNDCVAPAIVRADVDRAEWRAFVDAEPAANVFHTPEMAAAFARTPGHQVSPWAACSASGAILALIVPVHVTLAAGPLRRWTSRAVAYGGVARIEGAAGTAAAARLLHEYASRAQPELLFTELRHQDDATDLQAALRAAGFVHEAHLNYLITLDRSEADLWRGLGRSARQRVRSAEKKGIKVVEADDDATVDAAYRLLVDVYRRARVPLVSPTMFAAARAELHARGMLRIVTAQLDERVVAARFLLLHKSRIVDWYAGSDRSFASYSPTEYLVWEVLRWGREHGYEVFDFGGAGRPDEPYGPREFKSKFGGELVGFGREVFVHAPHRLRVSRAAYSTARRLRRGVGA